MKISQISIFIMALMLTFSSYARSPASIQNSQSRLDKLSVSSTYTPNWKFKFTSRTTSADSNLVYWIYTMDAMNKPTRCKAGNLKMGSTVICDVRGKSRAKYVVTNKKGVNNPQLFSGVLPTMRVRVPSRNSLRVTYDRSIPLNWNFHFSSSKGVANPNLVYWIYTGDRSAESNREAICSAASLKKGAPINCNVRGPNSGQGDYFVTERQRNNPKVFRGALRQ